MERRKAVRFRLAASAVFYWESSEHRSLRGEGMTRDVSSTSAYILAAVLPPIEAVIWVDIFLSQIRDTVPRARIRTKATVLRIENTEGTATGGFAVLGEAFKFWPLNTTGDGFESGPDFLSALKRRMSKKGTNGMIRTGNARRRRRLGVSQGHCEFLER
jgi:hypothetical protein